MARQEELDKLRKELGELRHSNFAVADTAQSPAEADLRPDKEPVPADLGYGRSRNDPAQPRR